MKEYQVAIEQGTKYEIVIKGYKCGQDYSFTICGGESHHIGAVALACVRPFDPKLGRNSSSVSVITAHDHKDDEVAREMASFFANALGCRVSVSAGIHIDNAQIDEIKRLLVNCRQGFEQLLQQIQKNNEV